jgi:tetratricopeptide (TPR) repeat protein
MAADERSEQGDGPLVSSVLSGTAANAVVAGAVDGGIHFHDSAQQERRPQQVPRSIGFFVNQQRALGELADSSILTADYEFRNSVVLITGTAGIGKTSLAIHWAHENSALFPDGQLYLNMRGFDPSEPIGPLDALTFMLPALGVPATAIPDDLEAAAARLRTELADRRMLLLLDNVAAVSQVRPLLPGNGRCMLLTTSRNSLAGLVSRDGARRIELAHFSPDHEVLMLRSLLSSFRAGDDEDGLTELADLCARLPLALRVAAERAIERPRDSLVDLLHELRAESSLWQSLSTDDNEEGDSIRAVFTWSYRALALSAARTFRMLGLHPGQEISTDAAAALVGVAHAAARADLERLVGAHMIESEAKGRYQFHDLLRAYALDQVAEEPESERIAAVNREVAWYAHSAANAVAAAQQLLSTGVLDPPPAGCTPATFGPRDAAESRDAAIKWYQAERTNLRSVSGIAVQYGLRRWTWQLAIALYPIHHATRSSFRDWLVMAQHGLEAARADGETLAVATLLTARAVAFTEQTPRRLDEAVRDLEMALAIWREIGDSSGEVRAVNALGCVALRRRRLHEAAAFFDQVHTLGERLPKEPWAAIGLENACLAYYELGDFTTAADLITQGLATLADLVASGDYTADQRLEFDMRILLTRVQRGQGLLEEASTALDLVRALAAEQRDPAGYLMWERLEQGHLELAGGAPKAAQATLLDAVRACRAVGDQALEAAALTAIGDTYRALGDNVQAQTFYRTAAVGYAAAQEPWHEAAARARLARSLTDDGHIDAARVEAQAALELIADYNDTGIAGLRREMADALGE